MKTTKGKIADTVGELKANVTDGATGVRDRLTDTASDLRGKIADTAGDLGDRAKALQTTVADKLPVTDGTANVLPLLIGTTLLGLAAGLLIPLTAIERERLQPIGDELARKASEARSEVVAQGQAVVDETVSAAVKSVRTHGRQAAEHLGMTPDAEPTSV